MRSLTLWPILADSKRIDTPHGVRRKRKKIDCTSCLIRNIWCHYSTNVFFPHSFFSQEYCYESQHVILNTRFGRINNFSKSDSLRVQLPTFGAWPKKNRTNSIKIILEWHPISIEMIAIWVTSFPNKNSDIETVKQPYHFP